MRMVRKVVKLSSYDEDSSLTTYLRCDINRVPPKAKDSTITSATYEIKINFRLVDYSTLMLNQRMSKGVEACSISMG
jgi:hypothetical protein